MISTDVHTEHCCALHGCKYGNLNNNCTVVNGEKPQTFLCWPDCESDNIDDFGQLHRAIVFDKKVDAIRNNGWSDQEIKYMKYCYIKDVPPISFEDIKELMNK